MLRPHSSTFVTRTHPNMVINVYDASIAFSGITIYTGYFARLKAYPDNVLPVSVARFTPYWAAWHGKRVPEMLSLAPSAELLAEYKDKYEFTLGHYPEEMQDRYIASLDRLDPKTIYRDLRNLLMLYDVTTSEPSVILCCYETPNKFCHRRILSNWLRNHGFNVRGEYAV